MTRQAGYVQLQRGLGEHLEKMGPHGATVYVWLLINACPEEGPKAGQVLITISDLALALGMSRGVITSSLKTLTDLGYLAYTPAPNQYRDGLVTVTKYKPTIRRARPSGGQADGQAPGQADGQASVRHQVKRASGTRSSERRARGADQGEQAPENLGELQQPGEPEQPTSHGPEEAVRLAELLATRLRERDPKAKTNPDLWAKDIEKIQRIDGREWAEIEAVIEWCQADTFWQSNIRSGRNLRAKFDELRDKMRAGSRRGPRARKSATDREDLSGYDR